VPELAWPALAPACLSPFGLFGRHENLGLAISSPSLFPLPSSLFPLPSFHFPLPTSHAFQLLLIMEKFILRTEGIAPEPSLLVALARPYCAVLSCIVGYLLILLNLTPCGDRERWRERRFDLRSAAHATPFSHMGPRPRQAPTLHLCHMENGK
jgi:hypothetical protein